MGGDEFDGSFDLLGSCYFLLHFYSAVVRGRHLAVKRVVECDILTSGMVGDVCAPVARRKRCCGLCEAGVKLVDSN